MGEMFKVHKEEFNDQLFERGGTLILVLNQHKIYLQLRGRDII